MKLLFDENLSPRLVQLVSSGYPGSVHVREVGLRGHVDDDLWAFARATGFTIVSKDTDFRERSYVEGFPPKIIWLDVGIAGTSTVAQLLADELEGTRLFELDGEASILILSLSKNAV